MTKADIINQIAESTGVAKKDVSATVEAFMECIPRFRKLHHQAQSREDSPQHLEEHHHHDCRSRLPQLQARQELR